jgi:hypothetical protein
MTFMRQKTVQLPVKGEPKQTEPAQVSLQELLDSLKSLQDDIGQISELASEEKRVVAVFFESLLKLMQPLAKTMPVSSVALPEEMGNVVQANIDPTGHLMILYQDGQVELRDLSEEMQRDLMVSVIKDVMPKFKQLTSAHRRKIENRIEFLSSVTNEMQKISKAFSTATT